ncbi:MAG: hypothetical protein HXS47_07865 [Theionarchaea archaeon]|nr:hypothetical protein [Theionarchaea archaeon]
MCQSNKECAYDKDAKGCALHHIEKARTLLSEKKITEADDMLKYAQDHLKEL